jgi:hypothetical protein
MEVEVRGALVEMGDALGAPAWSGARQGSASVVSGLNDRHAMTPTRVEGELRSEVRYIEVSTLVSRCHSVQPASSQGLGLGLAAAARREDSPGQPSAERVRTQSAEAEAWRGGAVRYGYKRATLATASSSS